MKCPKKLYDRCIKMRCPYHKLCDFYRLWRKSFLLGLFIGQSDKED